MNTKIVVLNAKQGSILRGHPWLYPKAISKQVGKLLSGSLVDLYNESGDFLGTGAYNEHSLYRVRVLSLSTEPCATLDYPGLIAYRLRQAQQIRQCLNLPNQRTTAYRLFNSEADGLSGLTVDRFNHLIVVASSAFWVEANKTIIKATLRELYPADELIWVAQKKALSQDGWDEVEEAENLQQLEVLEAGVVYQVRFATSQKTGLFIDQRENHCRIAELSFGKKVLDLYTYTGGFALHAAKAGASAVTAIDSSAPAIAQAKINASLNGLNQIEFIEGDARHYLEKACDYDLVILDPPKLVPSQKHIQKAKNYYRFLHREVFKAMKSGSLLMTCNCSSALNATEFTALVSAQAAMVGKQARILGVYGPASCHPTLSSFPEGNYLTAVLLGVV